jgi:NAD(P)H dehydrogenase (quinone)
MSEPIYAVIGATGNTGQATVQSLLERGASVRALVRAEDDRSAALAAAGADIAVIDLFDPRTIEPALVGVTGVYLPVPPSDYMLEAVAAFLVAARNSEVTSVVYLSQWLAHHSAIASGPNHASRATRLQWHGGQLLDATDMNVTHLIPGFFAGNTFMGLPAVMQTGELRLPFGDGLNVPPTNNDIGRVAAGVLVDPAPYVGQRLRPTSATTLTPDDLATALGSALGKPVPYVAIDNDEFITSLQAAGMIPDSLIENIVLYADEYRAGTFNIGGPTNTVATVGGQPPENLEEFYRAQLTKMGIIS